jgi:hypothetical protein
MTLRLRALLALGCTLVPGLANAQQPGTVHRAPVLSDRPAAPSGQGLQVQFGGRSPREAAPLKPLQIPTRKIEREPSSTQEFNPLKRRRMAMPGLPGDDGTESAF